MDFSPLPEMVLSFDGEANFGNWSIIAMFVDVLVITMLMII